MAFVGRLAYLVLFPGLLFVLAAGGLAWSAARRLASLGSTPELEAGGIRGILAPLRDSDRGGGGEYDFLHVSCPAVKMLSLAWVSCMVFGALGGDLVLAYALLLLALGCDLLAGFMAPGAEARRAARERISGMAGWAAPFALVLAGASLRTGRVGVTAVIDWQAANGSLVSSPLGGALATAGSAVLLAAALLCSSALAGMRPLGGGIRTEDEAGRECALSGVRLSLQRGGRAAQLFVAALVVCALFLAGPASTWYEVLLWALKVAGLVGVFTLLELGFGRLGARVPASRAGAAAFILAAAGLALTWAAVA